MSNANKIINVLVLVAAVAAVVLGIMLFNKREDVAAGRAKMAEAIAANTSKLIAEQDKKNMQRQAVKAEDMAISKTAEELAAPLKKFDAAAKKIAQQRDDLAKYALELTAIISGGKNMEGFSAENLADYTLNQDEAQKLTDRVTERAEQSKAVNAAFVAAIQSMNGKLKMDELDAAKLDTVTPDLTYLSARADAIAAKAQDQAERNELYSQHVKALASIMSADEPALDSADYANLLSEQRVAFETKMREYNDLAAAKKTLTEQLEAANAKVADNSTAVENSKKAAVILEKELAAAKNEIKRLNNIIAPAMAKVSEQGKGEEQIALNTNFNQLKKVQAKVLFADPANSFVVISLGQKVQVESKDDNGKAVKTDVQIPPNAVLTVASSLDPAKAKFAGKIQITSAGDKESVANILPSPGAAVPVIGDIVYFSSYDLEAVRQENEKRLADMRAKESAAAGAANAAAVKENMDELLGDSSDETEDDVL